MISFEAFPVLIGLFLLVSMIGFALLIYIADLIYTFVGSRRFSFLLNAFMASVLIVLVSHYNRALVEDFHQYVDKIYPTEVLFCDKPLEISRDFRTMRNRNKFL